MKTGDSGNIQRVLPYSVPDTNNDMILNKLKPINREEIKKIRQNTIATIPIPKQLDVSELISHNTDKLFLVKHLVYQKSVSLVQGDSNIDANVITTEVNEPRFFVHIDKLYPQNLQDQLCIVIIQNFPNIERLAIETILKKLTNCKFVWSYFEYEFIENQSIFVKFTTIDDSRTFYKRFHEKLPQILQNNNIRIILDSTIENYFETNNDNHTNDNNGDDNDHTTDNNENGEDDNFLIPESTISSIKLLLNTKRVEGSKTVEDSTEVSQYYRNYKVDSAELVDVPNNMKESIVKDIIKFRSSVLILEQQNRKKELERERQNTKLRLKKFTEDIKEANDEMIINDTNEYDRVKSIDQFEDLNDQEYEKYLADKANEENEYKYQEKLIEMKKAELNEKQYLTKKLNSLKDYESNLLDNKIKYIDDLRDLNIDQKNSSLPSILHLHLKNYSQYLKLRSQKRSLEEILDAKDEKEELEETKRKQPEPIKANLKVTSKPKLVIPVVDIKELLVDQTDKLNKKIEQLVEEYLGVKDEYLVDTIKEHLKDNNLSARDMLIAELTEILDDDAVNLVDDLHSYIGKHDMT